MKTIKLLLVAIVASILPATSIQAQGLKDLFKKENLEGLVDKLKGDKKFDITGTWTYKGSAIEFETEDFLRKAGGDVAAKMAEDKLDEQLGKIGFVPGRMSYTFNSDSTFVYSNGRRPMPGTYTFDAETKELVMKFLRIFDSTAQVKIVGNKMDILFKSDKLLALLTRIASKSKSHALQGIGKLTESYDGMRMGFSLERQVEE